MSSYPNIPFTNIFNPNDFTEIDGSLSLADADARYFKNSGGTISGLTSFLASVNVNGDINTSSLLKVTRSTSGQSFSSLNGSSQFALYHENSHDVWLGTVSPNNFIIQTNNSPRLIISSSGSISGISSLSAVSLIASSTLTVNGIDVASNLAYLIGITSGICSSSKALIVDSSRNITNINSLSTTSLIINGIGITSSDLAYLSGITEGTCSASKALVVDSNKNIAGIGIISSNGIALTPTTYNLTSPNIPGCLWRSNSGRLCAFREIDTNNWSLGYSGGGLWNDILVMSNSTYRITVNGDLNYTGSLRSSGTVVLDSSRNLTCNSASVRNNSQTSGTRVEYLSIGRETGSDYGAWSFQNYYQSSTSQQANYCTFTPSLKTSLNSGYGICFNQSGQVSFQDVNAGSGAGGIKTASNIIGCIDIYGGKTNNIGSGHGYLQPDSGSPADYNPSSVSSRIGLFVENCIWTGDRLYASSDIRLKRDIEPISLDQAKRLLDISSVSYRWRRDREDHTKDVGFLAQDFLENKLEQLVSFCPTSDEKNFPKGYSYGLEYSKICVYQNELIKDLYVQIEELKKKIKLVKT